MDEKNGAVEAHYTHGGLLDAIRDGLQQAGIGLERVTREDLAPLDAFHIRGLEATRALTAQAGLTEQMRVLDVGSGLGGSARYMATEYGCRVDGVDLTREYCEVAATLSEWLKVERLVTFHHGSALDLPFDAATFDRAWTEHVQMNIADKARFYGEIHRVLKPGGRLLFHDVLAGPGGEIYFPAPWAEKPEHNHLITPEALRPLLEGLGFEVLHWEDCTQKSLAWFETRMEKMKRDGPPPLGSHIIHGDQAKTRLGNQVRNLAEGRIVLVQAALEKK